MYGHERDPVSLVLGLLLSVTAVLFLIDDTTGLGVDPRWAGAIALILVGVAGVAATVRHGAAVLEAADKDPD